MLIRKNTNMIRNSVLMSIGIVDRIHRRFTESINSEHEEVGKYSVSKSVRYYYKMFVRIAIFPSLFILFNPLFLLQKKN